MPVKSVELVHLHDVEISLHFFHSEEMTRLIKVKSTITEARCIVDLHTWDSPVSRCRSLCIDLHRKHLLDGLDGIIETSERRSLNSCTLSVNRECICLFRKFSIDCEDKSCLSGSLCNLTLLRCHKRKLGSKGLHKIHGLLIHLCRIMESRTRGIEVTCKNLHIIRERNYSDI